MTCSITGNEVINRARVYSQIVVSHRIILAMLIPDWLKNILVKGRYIEMFRIHLGTERMKDV